MQKNRNAPEEYNIQASKEQAGKDAQIRLNNFNENQELAQSYGQIEETKENQNPLILTYQVNKTYIQQFFEAMKQNLGSETTYDPSCVGGWARSFTLYCESGNVFEYHGNYCTDSNENSLTTNIVEELLTKCQIVI